MTLSKQNFGSNVVMLSGIIKNGAFAYCYADIYCAEWCSAEYHGIIFDTIAKEFLLKGKD